MCVKLKAISLWANIVLFKIGSPFTYEKVFLLLEFFNQVEPVLEGLTNAVDPGMRFSESYVMMAVKT